MVLIHVAIDVACAQMGDNNSVYSRPTGRDVLRF